MSECAGNCNGKCEGSRVLSSSIRDTGGEQWSGNTYTPSLYPTPRSIDDDPVEEASKLVQALAVLNESVDRLGKAVAVTQDRLSSVTNHQPRETELKGGMEETCVSVNSPLLDGIFDVSN